MFGRFSMRPSITCLFLLSLMVLLDNMVGEVFCVHGGLSPDIHAIDQIR